MHKACFVGQDHGLYTIAQMVFRKDAANVGFHGARAEVKLLGDLAVGEALRDQSQDITLTFGELRQLNVGPGPRRRDEPLHQAPGDGGS
jgi:hypothetical protein